MKVYTAEDSGGEIWYLVSRTGYGREDFKRDVLAWVKDEDGDVAPPELKLYEWPDHYEAGVWLTGEPPQSGMKGLSWKERAKEAEFGEVKYVYPGDFVVQ